MSIQYRSGTVTAHITLEMLSDGISEHQTFKIFLGEHAPRPPYMSSGYVTRVVPL